MANDIRKYFSVNRNYVDASQKVLVESGISLVKKFITNKIDDKNKELISVFSDNKVDDYEALNNEFTWKLVKYSLERAGVDTTDKTIDCIKNPQLNKMTSFRETFNAVIAQILTPIVPAMVSANFMGFADVNNIAWGDTARYVIHSNDAFYVTRLAEGIKQGSVQRLYNNEVTLNPEPYNVTVAVDWYQVAAGIFDIGEWAYKVGYSFSAHITNALVAAFNTHITAGIAASSPYFVNGFTTSKFATMGELLRTANGGMDVRCYGTLPALSAVVPGTEASTKIANLQVGLGEEWATFGHIGKYMGIDLVRIPQIMVPNTVNTTALLGVPTGTLYFMADGGYKPGKICFEGQAITIDIVPTDAPDKEMGMNVTSRYAVGLATSTKFGAMTGVTL